MIKAFLSMSALKRQLLIITNIAEHFQGKSRNIHSEGNNYKIGGEIDGRRGGRTKREAPLRPALLSCFFRKGSLFCTRLMARRRTKCYASIQIKSRLATSQKCFQEIISFNFWFKLLLNQFSNHRSRGSLSSRNKEKKNWDLKPWKVIWYFRIYLEQYYNCNLTFYHFTINLTNL